MLDELKAIKGTPKNLRSFGCILGGILIVFGLSAWWKGRPSAYIWSASGIFFLAAGALKPGSLALVYRLWMSAALMIGWVITRVLLTVLFYLILTPLGIMSRASGKNILAPKSAETYWIPRTAVKTKTNYENQF